jgi:hypothetical protein
MSKSSKSKIWHTKWFSCFWTLHLRLGDKSLVFKHKIELECQRRVIKENAYTYSNIGNGLDAIKIDEYTFNTFINIWFFIRRFKF